MIQFEDILKDIVESMAAVYINDNLSKKPVFYWGTSQDLPQFLKVYKEDSYPLIWSVTKEDKKSVLGFERDVELCFCTRETRELLNTERMEAAFKLVLIPLWDAFNIKVKRSSNLEIVDDTENYLKAPNYSVSDAKKQSPVADIWDVYKVSFTANFYENNNC
jgi:hypothetical protein